MRSRAMVVALAAAALALVPSLPSSAASHGAVARAALTSAPWSYTQAWGDWCMFDEATAAGHAAPQTYTGTVSWDWSVDATGTITQTLVHRGQMTTEGVTRSFHAELVTRGPASAYWNGNERDPSDYLRPKFYTSDLTATYEWTVDGFYTFIYRSDGDGDLSYGATSCN